MHTLRIFDVARSMVVVALMGSGTGWAQTVGGGGEVGANIATETVMGTSGSARLPLTTAGWLERAVDREVSRLKFSASAADSVFQAVQQPGPRKRSWIGRHPALFGALVGFGGGFLIGYLPGDDAVFDDFTAEFNGLVLGGVGALVGTIVGEVTK